MYKKAFEILKNNMIFIQPLLIWQIVFSAVMLFSLSRNQMLIPKLVMYFSVLVLCVACLSGWLYINKYGVLSYNEKDSKEQITEKTIQNFKKFFEGIGFNFFKILLSLFLIGVVYYAFCYIIYKFCISNFGIPDFIHELVKIVKTSDKDSLMQFVNNIPDKDKIVAAKWIFTTNTVVSVMNFFTLLYFAVLSFEQKNFFISFFIAFRFFIVNLFEAIGIMIFTFILYLGINMLSLYTNTIPVLFALMVIILTMYFNYYLLLVFCFYHDKAKNNSNNRPEFSGEDETCDTTGKDI